MDKTKENRLEIEWNGRCYRRSDGQDFYLRNENATKRDFFGRPIGGTYTLQTITGEVLAGPFDTTEAARDAALAL